MNTPATIQTPRLILRPRSPTDLESCMAMDRDRDVTRYIEGPWDDPEAHLAFLQHRMDQNHPFPFGYWTITRIETPQQFLGWVMILPQNDALTRAEIGWRLARAAWGHGIGTEASLGVLNILRQHCPGTEVIAEIHPENTSSIKVAEKIGMTLIESTTSGEQAELIYQLRLS